MKWYTISWFGGFKTECEDCRRYETKWSESECIDAMHSENPINCSTCQLEQDLIDARKEVHKLTESIKGWKDAWFHQRDIIGDLHWNHPAIDSDRERAYYQDNQKVLYEKTNWTADSCNIFCNKFHDFLTPLGFDVALAGSMLFKGHSKKDIDLIVYPLKQASADKIKMLHSLPEFGLKYIRLPNGNKGYQDDGKDVTIWEYEGKRVDLFFLS